MVCEPEMSQPQSLYDWIAMGNTLASEWWQRLSPPEPPRSVLGQVTGTDLSRTAGVNAGDNSGLLLLLAIGLAIYLSTRK
jgi:hypothetical protein